MLPEKRFSSANREGWEDVLTPERLCTIDEEMTRGAGREDGADAEASMTKPEDQNEWEEEQEEIDEDAVEWQMAGRRSAEETLEEDS